MHVVMCVLVYLCRGTEGEREREGDGGRDRERERDL